MDMSTLIKTEHDNWKKRMMVETCGTYVLMNMGMGFVVIAGAFCGVMNTEFDLYYYNMVVFFTFGLYYAQSRYITYIWENGRKVNIFEKYIYLPVDLKKLRKAKLIVVAKKYYDTGHTWTAFSNSYERGILWMACKKLA